MKKVLIVLGSRNYPHLDLVNLEDELKARGMECTDCSWEKVSHSPGQYDLAVLFGLDDREKEKAHLFASTVRKAIGKNSKFLIVSKWNRDLFTEQQMGEKYDAEYFSRYGHPQHLIDTALRLLNEAKTAP